MFSNNCFQIIVFDELFFNNVRIIISFEVVTFWTYTLYLAVSVDGSIPGIVCREDSMLTRILLNVSDVWTHVPFNWDLILWKRNRTQVASSMEYGSYCTWGMLLSKNCRRIHRHWWKFCEVVSRQNSSHIHLQEML